MRAFKNQAFIDAQNLYLGTTKSDAPWILDLKRFRVYLAKKYCAEKAYYFLGAYEEKHQELYDFRGWRLLAPNRNTMSSLYKKISATYRDCLDSDPIKTKIQYEANKSAGSP